MAKLRKARSYRKLERPFTRKSKYRKKSFVRAVPNSKIVKFNMGNLRKKFDYTIVLKSKNDIQIRHNALESARQTSNRHMETNCGKTAYCLKILTYPHHVLRENPLAAGAGADRMSTGMAKSYGKSIGVAARIMKGQTVMQVDVDESNINFAKGALKKAQHKLPCSCTIEVEKNEVAETA